LLANTIFAFFFCWNAYSSIPAIIRTKENTNPKMTIEDWMKESNSKQIDDILVIGMHLEL